MTKFTKNQKVVLYLYNLHTPLNIEQIVNLKISDESN